MIVSGDLTDSGSPSAWKITSSILTKGLPRTRVIATPGNHDLNEFFGLDPTQQQLREKDDEITTDIEKMPRLSCFIVYQSLLFPSLQTYNNISLSKLVAEIPKKSTITPEEEQKCFKQCKDLWGPGMHETQQCFASCRQNWQFARFDYLYSFRDMFPLVYVDYDRGIAFLSFASTLYHSDTVGDNAIGEISEEQIVRARKLLNGLPPSVNNWVFTMHHPLIRQHSDLAFPFHLSDLRHPIAWADRLYESDWFLAIFLRNDPNESRKLSDVISKQLDDRPEAKAFVFYGHRHRRPLSRIG
nr:metallophosphoesterase [Edaphobacter lichenicola]